MGTGDAHLELHQALLFIVPEHRVSMQAPATCTCDDIKTNNTSVLDTMRLPKRLGVRITAHQPQTPVLLSQCEHGLRHCLPRAG